MAISTVIMISVFVATLLIYFTVEQQKDTKAEVQEGDFSDKILQKESTIIDVIPDLELGQTSCESGILEIQGHLNLPSATQLMEFPENQEELVQTPAEHQSPAVSALPRFQMAPLETIRTDAQAEILKTGLKIACLVISVSTTGIVTFLVGVSGNQSSTANKLHLKAVILSMCASLFSALILLIFSTLQLNFSCLILTVRIIIWISTSLMTLGVVLLITFYLHMA